MTKQTKQTLVRGLTFFLAGVVGLILQTNEQGLSAYFLILFGVWEIGDVIADCLFNDEEEATEKKLSRKKVIKKFKADVARLALPMLLSMMVEVAMSDTGTRVHILSAYLLVLFIYLLFMLYDYSYYL